MSNIKTNGNKKNANKSNGLVVLCLFVVANLFAQSTEKVYLSGRDNSDAKTWEFMCDGGMNANKWTTIGVPSCWELKGFGKYDYGFAKDSLRGKEHGFYKYNFFAPARWQGMNIRIVFEGVMTDADVKINGKQAGEIHQGAFYAFKYDISALLKYGQSNLLEVTVAKHSANASVNEAERKADFWIFGGIFRPVYLEVLPEQYIDEAFIDAKADGQFKASIVNGLSSLNKHFMGYVVKTTITEVKTNKVVAQFSSKGTRLMEAKQKISGIKQWTPETPNLYKASFTLSIDGKTMHTIEKRFGFRTIELKQRDGIYVNGVKVKMKGVNRHCFRPETGRTLSKQNSIEDILLMKDMNMNAVRCSHYPPDDHFLDACDSLGLFVMDELAGWHGHYDTKTGTKLIDEMMRHDYNHPSIIFWANGNEGGHNFELDSLFGDSRPVVHPWQLFNGIETQHYREYNYGIGNYENGREIVMPTEFLHGQFDGGHGAGLEDYWEKMWYNPLSAGGFLWDFADNAVVRKDLHDSLDTDKNRAADGILGPHHEKEGSYFAIKEVWSPVYFERKEITNDFDGAFNIQNRYFYTNTNQCTFNYTFRFLGPFSFPDISGSIAAPSIKPSEKGSIKISLPKNWKDYSVIYITAKGPDGHELFTWSFPIQKVSSMGEGLATDEGYSAPKVTEQDSIYLVKTEDIEFRFNRINGKLVSARNANGIVPLANGPVLEQSVNNLKNFSYHFEDKHLIIESQFDRKTSYNTLKWTIYPTGTIRMDVSYFPIAYFTDYTGVSFSFPEKDMRFVSYLGDGPYRVWKNRMKGTKFGLWTKQYNNTETGEQWVYPEFKGYYSNIYHCSFATDNTQVIVSTETENVFLRLFTPAWKTDQWHNYEPLFPSGDISFLQGIPGIGTKTQRAETTGPMGMKNIFYDYEKDPSRALKLTLFFNFHGYVSK